MTSSFDSDEEESETDEKLASRVVVEPEQLREDGFTTVDVAREAIEEFVK
jgi:hypothetical protein